MKSLRVASVGRTKGPQERERKSKSAHVRSHLYLVPIGKRQKAQEVLAEEHKKDAGT